MIACSFTTEMMQKFKFLSKDKKSRHNNAGDKTDKQDCMSTVSERKLVSRNAVICSSGKVSKALPTWIYHSVVFWQDKYRFDSERAEIPSRPVDVELEGTSYLQVNHLELNSNSVLSCSERSLCNSVETNSHFGANLGKESCNHVVKRDTVVKRFDLQPSMLVDGKFHNPWCDYKPHSFTNILKLGLSQGKSNVSSKQVISILFYFPFTSRLHFQ